MTAVTPERLNEAVQALAESGICPAPFTTATCNDVSCEECWDAYLSGKQTIHHCTRCDTLTKNVCECSVK